MFKAPAMSAHSGIGWSGRIAPSTWPSCLEAASAARRQRAIGFATRVFPAESLEQETYDYARRVARVPAQKLRLEKLAINRAMDLQGFRVAVLAGAEFDAIFHFGPGNEEIRAVQKERGLRGAIEWYEKK